MGRRLTVPIIVGLGLFAALAAAVAFSSASVSYRAAQQGDQWAGEVLIGEEVVIELRTAAGGFTPLERAEVVANRLRAALAEDFGAEAVEAGPLASGHAVFISDRQIAQVSASEAEAHGTTTQGLAEAWRGNILSALGLELPEQPAAGEGQLEEGTPAAGAGAEATAGEQAQAEASAVDWTGAAQKIVPIVSLSGEGVSAGVAQVAGPPAQLDKVKAVAELRLSFQSFGRIYAYIPVSSISAKPQRVQGVSVWAIGDVKLVNF